MKTLLLAGLLGLAGLTGCSKKEEAAPALSMTALINGQSFEATEKIGLPFAQIDQLQNYPTPRNAVLIEGISGNDITALGIKNCTIYINATYLPKIGHHDVNDGYPGQTGSANPKGNNLAIEMQYQRQDGVNYHAFANSGFVEITQASDMRVAGTFEFSAIEFNNPSTAPVLFKVAKGQFNARIIDMTPLPIAWDGVQ